MARRVPFVAYHYLENGTDIDNWTVPELETVVYEFQSYYGVPQMAPVEAQQQLEGVQQEPEGVEPIEEALMAQEAAEERKQSMAPMAGSNQEALQEINKNKRQAEKQYIGMRKCEDVATILNFKRVDVTVAEGLVKEGGIFSASYPTYRVISQGSGIAFDVRRKDADFAFLRKHLLRCFPHLIIPPCPKEQPKLLADKIKRRERYYTRFL